MTDERLAAIAHTGFFVPRKTIPQRVTGMSVQGVDTHSQPASRRRSRLVLAGLALCTLVLTTGIILHFGRQRSVPTPPEVNADQLEPAVVEAIRKARERVLKEPRSAAAWGEFGKVLLANELEEESNICFAEAERLDPSEPRWPYYQGGSLVNQGDRQGALAYFQRAAERTRTKGGATNAPSLYLAETFLALGRLDEAEREYRQVLARDSDDPRAHLGMGMLAMAREDWETSRTHLLRCMNNPSAQKKACTFLSTVSRQLGDKTDAEEYQQRAERLPPDTEWNDAFVLEYMQLAVKKRRRYHLVENLDAAGRVAEAAQVMQKMADEFPDDYLAQLTLGKELGKLGEHRRAEQALRKALRLAPDKAQTHYYLGLVMLMAGQERSRQGDAERARAHFTEAAELSRQALAIIPDYGYAHMSLGLALKNLGERAEAISALRRAVQCNPELPELHYYLGEALAEEGKNPTEARRHLEHALKFAPREAPWRSTAQTCLDHLEKR
jgi:tetratricopeptide (TPR) repeat protein